MRLWVKVVPGSSRDAIRGFVGDALKITVRAPPEQGKANAAVIELIASALALPTAAVRVVSGHASPRKWLEVDGMDMAALCRALNLPQPL